MELARLTQAALAKLRELSQPIGGVLAGSGARTVDITDLGGGLIRLTLTQRLVAAAEDAVGDDHRVQVRIVVERVPRRPQVRAAAGAQLDVLVEVVDEARGVVDPVGIQGAA